MARTHDTVQMMQVIVMYAIIVYLLREGFFIGISGKKQHGYINTLRYCNNYCTYLGYSIRQTHVCILHFCHAVSDFPEIADSGHGEMLKLHPSLCKCK